MKIVLLLILSCIISIKTEAQRVTSKDTLDNVKLIKMVKSGLSDLLIKKSIENSNVYNFDLTSEGLIKLKQNKVSDSLIVKMFEKDNVEDNYNQKPSSNTKVPINNPINQITNIKSLENLSPGIYYESLNNKQTDYIKLNGVISTYKMKTDIIIGITTKSYYSVSNNKALIKIEGNLPTFFLVVGNAGDINFEPSRFIVMKSTVKNSERIIPAYSGFVGMGMVNKSSFDKKSGAIIPTYTRISNTLYKITFEKKLPKGNYFFGPSQLQFGYNQTFLEFDVD